MIEYCIVVFKVYEYSRDEFDCYVEILFMAILEIEKYPAGILRQKAGRIEDISPKIEQLTEDMVKTMYVASGVGLAGPQVGMDKRIFVVDPEPERKKPLIFINPEIISKEGRAVSEEGCLSLPGMAGQVSRAESIVVRAMDIKGKSIELRADGLFARIIQHELDHLNGVLFVDKLGFLKRYFLLRKYKTK